MTPQEMDRHSDEYLEQMCWYLPENNPVRIRIEAELSRRAEAREYWASDR